MSSHLGDDPSGDFRTLPSAAQLTRHTLAIVLAGGRGERLGALTAWRAKPSVPFGGKFRIIDFTLSSCVNSGIRRIGICTQYRAASLIRHVQRGWSFLDGRFDEFVELLPAQQRTVAAWYRGTADAVRQNMDFLERHDPQFVLVLAADHVYKMDYAKMIAEHVARAADVSIACVEVPLREASQLGIMEVDGSWHVTGFSEKPASPVPMPGRSDAALASMGVYVFNTAFLIEQLRCDDEDPQSSHDFGRNIIPQLVRLGARAYAHRFVDSCVNMSEGKPYWRDVGSIDAFWEANLELTMVTPDLNLYDSEWPIWTYQEQLPPAKFVFDEDSRRGHVVDSLVAGGCIVSGAEVRRSVLFSAVRVHSYAKLDQCVVLPSVDIGRHARLKRVVIDRQCRIPDGTVVGFDPAEDRKRFHVTDAGVTLITPDMLGQKVHNE
ncbi:MAG TPA: glucose-1-phosphate adenylyltransferase [Gemmatimonadaceae bacterium]